MKKLMRIVFLAAILVASALSLQAASGNLNFEKFDKNFRRDVIAKLETAAVPETFRMRSTDFFHQDPLVVARNKSLFEQRQYCLYKTALQSAKKRLNSLLRDFRINRSVDEDNVVLVYIEKCDDWLVEVDLGIKGNADAFDEKNAVEELYDFLGWLYTLESASQEDDVRCDEDLDNDPLEERVNSNPAGNPVQDDLDDSDDESLSGDMLWDSVNGCFRSTAGVIVAPADREIRVPILAPVKTVQVVVTSDAQVQGCEVMKNSETPGWDTPRENVPPATPRPAELTTHVSNASTVSTVVEQETSRVTSQSSNVRTTLGEATPPAAGNDSRPTTPQPFASGVENDPQTPQHKIIGAIGGVSISEVHRMNENAARDRRARQSLSDQSSSLIGTQSGFADRENSQASTVSTEPDDSLPHDPRLRRHDAQPNGGIVATTTVKSVAAEPKKPAPQPKESVWRRLWNGVKDCFCGQERLLNELYGQDFELE